MVALAAAAGATGSGREIGQMSESARSSRPAAARRRMASNGLGFAPVSTGLWGTGRWPASNKRRSSADATVVFPTPVSVPTMKSPGFSMALAFYCVWWRKVVEVFERLGVKRGPQEVCFEIGRHEIKASVKVETCSWVWSADRVTRSREVPSRTAGGRSAGIRNPRARR